LVLQTAGDHEIKVYNSLALYKLIEPSRIELKSWGYELQYSPERLVAEGGVSWNADAI
jgi:hypothetical protein